MAWQGGVGSGHWLLEQPHEMKLLLEWGDDSEGGL